jgi:hypothetical protein
MNVKKLLSTNECVKALSELVNFALPIKQLSDQVAAIGWDTPGDMVTMKRRHLASALSSYLDGHLTREEIFEWANLLEIREDIDFESGDDVLIPKLIFKLANPEIEGDLTPERARSIIEMLERR